MNPKAATTIIAVAFAFLGMTGIYLRIEYSGWVLATGCLAAWSL